ncbi:hypothetical protein PILCRDRAFT_74371 [Piloderma croceum F 1598]|uniref:Amine oxidase domain-containing protein n=1 Tax=Piloderma croceum (strain F 1598) TaxID=765440 RepID=A0A0C3FIF8_PILCF|nr:hypothetical protein PILCRDRAFT_74371 [Piloderma croceum F 1598]
MLGCIAAVAGANPAHNDHVITRDICVIGGGAAGTYAAVRLGDMNQSVIVIEHKDRLGGNTQTFTDPITGAKADIGVQVWHVLDIVKNFFSRFNVPLTTTQTTASSVEFIDFTNGAKLKGYPGNQGNLTVALQAYAAQLAKYPFLDAGFDLPDPVPTDLLMPFGDFVAKYNLSAAMTVLPDFAAGLGTLTKYPTLYFMKVAGLTILQSIQTGFYTTAHHDNSEIYQNAQAALLAADSLLLNSHIVATERGNNGGPVKLVVSTPSGHRVIQAKKIIFAIPPTLENLHNFDIDSEERHLFEQFSTTGYYTGLLRNSGVPANAGTITDRGLHTTFHVPKLPNIFSTYASAILGLQQVFYGSDTVLPIDQVKHSIITTMQQIFPNATATVPPVFAVFSSHSPFVFMVPSSAIKAGFYRKLSNLQGHRHMFYAGAAFQTQDSSLIWQFIEGLLPHVVA